MDMSTQIWGSKNLGFAEGHFCPWFFVRFYIVNLGFLPPCNSRKRFTSRFKRGLLLTSFWDCYRLGAVPNVNHNLKITCFNLVFESPLQKNLRKQLVFVLKLPRIIGKSQLGGGFMFFFNFRGNDAIWRAYFSDGLKPPTRPIFPATVRLPNMIVESFFKLTCSNFIFFQNIGCTTTTNDLGVGIEN